MHCVCIGKSDAVATTSWLFPSSRTWHTQQLESVSQSRIRSLRYDMSRWPLFAGWWWTPVRLCLWLLRRWYRFPRCGFRRSWNRERGGGTITLSMLVMLTVLGCKGVSRLCALGGGGVRIESFAVRVLGTWCTVWIWSKQFWPVKVLAQLQWRGPSDCSWAFAWQESWPEEATAVEHFEDGASTCLLAYVFVLVSALPVVAFALLIVQVVVLEFVLEVDLALRSVQPLLLVLCARE